MRNTLVAILFMSMLAACTSETGDADSPIADYLVSKPVWVGLAMIVGAAACFLCLRLISKFENAKRSRGRGQRQATVQVDKEPEHKVFQLEEELKQCRYEAQELRRALAEAERFSLAGLSQKEQSAGSASGQTDKTDKRENENNAEPDVQGTATIYYLQPTADGRFKEVSKVNSAAEALYEISYQKSGPSVASFKFIDTQDNVFLAIQNEATWILTACERSNIPTDDTRSIQTDVPGEARLENGEWRIVLKAKITYA